jgi:uncharacterized protein
MFCRRLVYAAMIQRFMSFWGKIIAFFAGASGDGVPRKSIFRPALLSERHGIQSATALWIPRKSLWAKGVLLWSGFFLLLCVRLFAASIPPHQGYVTDTVGVLSQAEKAQMVAYSTQLAQKTGVQVATLVVQDMGGVSIEEYANKVFASWKIGNKEDQGVLFVVALNERRLRYEVGYGAEAWLTDGKAGELLDTYVVPEMKRKAVSRAIVQGHVAVIGVAANEFKIQMDMPTQRAAQQPVPLSGDAVLLVILGIVLLGVVTRGRIFPWLLLMLLSASGGGRGGQGGGFGGFGGGRSGGGGSSRGW